MATFSLKVNLNFEPFTSYILKQSSINTVRSQEEGWSLKSDKHNEVGGNQIILDGHFSISISLHGFEVRI